MRSQLMTVLSVLAIFPTAALAETWSVPSDAPTIQIAINLASDGDEIVVAPGVYFETIDFAGKTLTIRSTAGPEATTINALGQFDSVVHCISGEGPETMLMGFTLRNGDATGGVGEDRGGAIFVQNASLTVVDCVLVDNVATYGGAIYGNGASLDLSGCIFTENTAGNSGGAVYVNDSSSLFINSCTFNLNACLITTGGALRTNGGDAVITNSTFTNNSSPDYGGAVGFSVGTPAVIARCVFAGNHAGDGDAAGRGGAISTGNGSPLTITDSLFHANAADQYGGALYGKHPMSVRGCTFAGNSTGSGVGGVSSGSSGSDAAFVNVIAAGNGASPITGPNAVSYSCVEGGHAGPGNIDSSPMFADAANGDFRLQPGSPCIDAGDTTGITSAYPLDLDQAPRAVDDPAVDDTGLPMLNLAVDMGAFERQPAPPLDPCPGDVNDDGMINAADLAEVLAGWGACP